jgi:hypothetical protein
MGEMGSAPFRVFFLIFPILAAAMPAPAEEITFRRDVWPIFERRCVVCHQAGEIAPMPLTSYREARPWAASIREAVLARSMPPWGAAAGSAHRFRNDRSLTDAELRTITAWIDGGAAEGTGAVDFHPAAPHEEGWKLGKPDLVLRVPGFAVPKSGTVPYSFLIFPGLFAKDTWVRAAEWRIQHRRMIHHMNAFVRAPGSSFLAGFPAGTIFVPTLADRGKRREGERTFDRRQLLLGYEPGYEPGPWLEGGAKLIKAGSDVIFEMHYTPNGEEATDYSELALYFAPAAPAYRVVAIDTLRDLDLAIPPGERNYTSNAAMTLAQSARLLSIQPHMHLRGKRMEVRAVFPGGETEVLLNVPRYDFNWQTTYSFQDPVTLPAGTRLESVAGFDNSALNLFNPDPSATVHWGDQTFEEMHIAFLELVVGAHADPESLLSAAPRMIGAKQ